MSDNKTNPVVNAAFLYTALMQKLSERPAEVLAKVNGHIKATSRHETIEAYHGNGASEEDKLQTYKLIIEAVLNNKPQLLKSAPVAKEPEKAPETPQVEPESPRVVQSSPKVIQLTPARQQEAPEPVVIDIQTAKKAPDVSKPAKSADPQVLKLAEAIHEAISVTVTPQVHEPVLSEERIRQIVDEQVKRTFFGLVAEVAGAIEAYVTANK